MWLLILGYSALASTLAYYITNGKYELKTLCIILWGATIMFFIDHLYGYFTEGGEFFDTSIDAAILGFSLLYTALLIWLTALLIRDPKGLFKKKQQSL